MLRRTLTLLALLCGCLIGAPAAADEPVRRPVYDPGEHPPASARYGIAAVGAATTLAWYGGSLGASYLWPDAPGARDLRIPVVGPWLALGETGCADNDPNCGSLMVVVRAILTTLDGIAQVGGLAVVGEALFMPAAAPSAPRERLLLRVPARSFKVRPAPIVAGKDGIGFGIAGQF